MFQNFFPCYGLKKRHTQVEFRCMYSQIFRRHMDSRCQGWPLINPFKPGYNFKIKSCNMELTSICPRVNTGLEGQALAWNKRSAACAECWNLFQHHYHIQSFPTKIHSWFLLYHKFSCQQPNFLGGRGADQWCRVKVGQAHRCFSVMNRILHRQKFKRHWSRIPAHLGAAVTISAVKWTSWLMTDWFMFSALRKIAKE